LLTCWVPSADVCPFTEPLPCIALDASPRALFTNLSPRTRQAAPLVVPRRTFKPTLQARIVQIHCRPTACLHLPPPPSASRLYAFSPLRKAGHIGGWLSFGACPPARPPPALQPHASARARRARVRRARGRDLLLGGGDGALCPARRRAARRAQHRLAAPPKLHPVRRLGNQNHQAFLQISRPRLRRRKRGRRVRRFRPWRRRRVRDRPYAALAAAVRARAHRPRGRPLLPRQGPSTRFLQFVIDIHSPLSPF